MKLLIVFLSLFTALNVYANQVEIKVAKNQFLQEINGRENGYPFKAIAIETAESTDITADCVEMDSDNYDGIIIRFRGCQGHQSLVVYQSYSETNEPTAKVKQALLDAVSSLPEKVSIPER
ncbi:MAG: hypothetical protein KDD50_06560 [Bdellovibrionales bacterium]|nr:hypothetical protein [Bdellovibrionales bacterium]